MTVSTANRLVLHSAEVAHLYPQVMFPILPGFAKPLNTFFGEWLGIHHEVFTKIPKCGLLARLHEQHSV